MKNINTKLSFTSFRLMYLSFQASTIWWTFLTTIALVRSGFRPKKLNAVAKSNTICNSGRYFFVPSTSFRWKKCFCSGNKLLKRTKNRWQTRYCKKLDRFTWQNQKLQLLTSIFALKHSPTFLALRIVPPIVRLVRTNSNLCCQPLR